jgi:hypothetical protein
VLATVGAGDIDTFVQPIKAMLKRKYEAMKINFNIKRELKITAILSGALLC